MDIEEILYKELIKLRDSGMHPDEIRAKIVALRADPEAGGQCPCGTQILKKDGGDWHCPRCHPDILGRAKATLAGWDCQKYSGREWEPVKPTEYQAVKLLPELIAEVERLRSVISEPVKSFGTMELVSWVNQLQKTISEYPDAEWGNWPFVLMMGVHCENFSKRWHSPTIEIMAARIKELETHDAALEERLRQELTHTAAQREIIDQQEARIKELEASWMEMAKAIARPPGSPAFLIRHAKEDREWLEAYVKRLEAALLKALQCPSCNGTGMHHVTMISRKRGDISYDKVCPLCFGEGEQKAREALERIKEGKG